MGQLSGVAPLSLPEVREPRPLDALLAEDLLYVHATGEVQAKEELITWLELEEADYVRIETSEVDVLVDGAVAKLVGWQSMEVRIGEQSFRPRIQCRERPNDAGLALGNDQLRTGNDKHWRTNDRDSQLSLEAGW